MPLPAIIPATCVPCPNGHQPSSLGHLRSSGYKQHAAKLAPVADTAIDHCNADTAAIEALSIPVEHSRRLRTSPDFADTTWPHNTIRRDVINVRIVCHGCKPLRICETHQLHR